MKLIHSVYHRGRKLNWGCGGERFNVPLLKKLILYGETLINFPVDQIRGFRPGKVGGIHYLTTILWALAHSLLAL